MANTNRKNNTTLWVGMLGGCLMILIFMVIAFSFLHLHDYSIHCDKIYINSANVPPSHLSCSDKKFNSCKQLLLDDLNKERLILTPQEYTNNLVNYYNSILLILSVMIAAFSVISFVYLRNQVYDSTRVVLNSNDFQEDVANKLLGKVEGAIAEEINSLNLEIKDIRNQLSKLDTSVESLDAEDDKEVEL